MKKNDGGYWPNTKDELLEVIEEELNKEHDYNTSVDALVECALATFNYCAHVLGITGFQASYADMMFIKRTRHLKGPFAILDGEKLLYPQYDLRETFEKYMREWPAQLSKLAEEKLAENKDGYGHPDVIARWKEIAALEQES